MSVALTTDAVRRRVKTVTRRRGWTFLRVGEQLTLCPKVQGRGPGEPLERICDVEVMSVTREPLRQITADEVAREGFPGMSPAEFVDRFFVREQKMSPDDIVTRIEWRYLVPPRDRRDLASAGTPLVGTDRAGDSDQVRALYRERAHLVAAVVRLAVLNAGRDAVLAYNDPAEPGLPVLYADTTAGQISWHIHPDDLHLFDGIDIVNGNDPRARWDGHDKTTALRRLERLDSGVDRAEDTGGARDVD